MMRALALVACFQVTGPMRSAVAQAVDCDRLMHSKAPFQLTMRDEAGKVVSFQIYRGDNLYRVEILKLGSGLAFVGSQANYPIVFMGPTGRTTFTEWNVPTSKYFFDSGITRAHAILRVDNKRVADTDYSFTLLGDESIAVGRCSVATKHYTVDYNQKLGLVSSEFWLSPELQAAVKWKNDVVSGNGTRIIHTAEPQSIETSFTPFQ